MKFYKKIKVKKEEEKIIDNKDLKNLKYTFSKRINLEKKNNNRKREKKNSPKKNFLFQSSDTNKNNEKMTFSNSENSLPEIINNLKNKIYSNTETRTTTNESNKNLIDEDKILSSNLNSNNNNIIIPIIPIRKLNSELNDNCKIFKTENNSCSRNNFSYSVEREKTFNFVNNNFPKLHKIKIQKGMLNSKFADHLNKKIRNFELNEFYLNKNKPKIFFNKIK